MGRHIIENQVTEVDLEECATVKELNETNIFVVVNNESEMTRSGNA